MSAGVEVRPAPRADVAAASLVALGAIAFSGKAIIVKLGLRLGADAVTLLALRMLVALPLFLLMGAWASRRATPLSAADRLRVFALGVSGYYLASLLDFLGLAHISATLERVILYLTPTFVLLLGAVLARRRPTRTQAAALAISYAGVALAFGHDLQTAGDQVLKGGLLVLGSALSYAVYLYGSGEIVGRVGAVRLTAWASTVASVLCIGQWLLLEPWTWPRIPSSVYALSLLNGTLCTVAPVLMTMIGVRRLGSGPASQIGMIGPVSTIVLSLLILHEPMGPWQIAGTGLVVAGVLAVSRAKPA